MESPAASLKFLVVVVLSAIFLAYFIKRRYGPVGRKLIDRLGPHWPMAIKIGSIATLILWMIYWVAVSPERRAELERFYRENAPWVLHDGQESGSSDPAS